MTQIVPESWHCPVCAAESEQMLVASTNTFGGSSDLDTRPAEMMRSTLPYDVWSCPECGFAGEPVAAKTDKQSVRRAAELVRSDAYRAQWRDRGYPDLANEFLCRALLREAMGQLAAAAWDALRAAWACDDARQAEAARRCRERAAELLRGAEERRQQTIEGGLAAAQLLLCDVLRRAGRFEEARAACHRGLSGRPKEPIRSLLEFELELITAEDDAAHTTSEVLGRS